MAANTISLSISSNVAASKNFNSFESRGFIAPPTICFPSIPGELSLSSTTIFRSHVRAGASASQLMNDKRSITAPTIGVIRSISAPDCSISQNFFKGLIHKAILFHEILHVHGKRVLVVTNERVAPLYLDKTIYALTRGNPNVTVESVILPDGEKYNDMESRNGERFLWCITGENNLKKPDVEELADFIACEPNKDYSDWLKGRERFRKQRWKSDKIDRHRWNKKQKAWRESKGRVFKS